MPLTFSWPRGVLVALITVVVMAVLACGESAAPDATAVPVESETQVSQVAEEQTVEPQKLQKLLRRSPLPRRLRPFPQRAKP